MIFATECHTINQSWVEEFPSYCSSGLLIHFIDQHNKNKSGYLTKYDGIVTDVSTFDNDCGTDSTFSLPQSMALVVRTKHGINRKEYTGPFKALESDSEKISIFFMKYKIFISNVYVFFARDVIMVFSIFVFFFLNFDKKKCIIAINFFIKKFIKKNENDQDEESTYSDYVTTVDLENRLAKSREGLVDYVDMRIFEVREIHKITNKVEQNPSLFHTLNENMNFIKELDRESIKYSDLQKILKVKQQKASGTTTELRDRLYKAIREEMKLN